MAVATEIFNDTKIIVTDEVFIARSPRALQFAEAYGYQIEEIADFGLSIVHKGQVIHEPNHPTSQASYHGRILDGDDKILIYTLRKSQETSAHSHQVNPWLMGEKYKGFGTNLYTENESPKNGNWEIFGDTFEESSEAYVRPGEKHFVWAKSRSGLNVVTMENALQYPESIQHILVADQRTFKDAAKSRLLTVRG